MDIPKSSLDVTYSSVVDEDKKRRVIYLLKIGFLTIFSLGSAIMLGQYLSYSFYRNIFSLQDIGIPLLISCVIFLTFFFHSVLFIQKKWPLVILAVCSWIAISINFVDFSDVVFLIGEILSLVFFLLAVFQTKAEIDTRIKPRFVHSLNGVTTKVMLAITVLLAAVLYSNLVMRELDENNLLFPRSVFDRIVPLAQGVSQKLIGDIDLKKPLREAAEEKVNSELIKQFGAERAVNLPIAIRENAIETYVKGLKDMFGGMFGMQIDESQTLSKLIYDGILFRINTADQGVKSIVIGFLAILFIFSIQIFVFVVRIFLIPIAYMLYEVLIRTKFAHIVYENTSKEIITI